MADRMTFASSTGQVSDNLRPQGCRCGLGAGPADDLPHVSLGLSRFRAVRAGVGMRFQPAHLLIRHLFVEKLEQVIADLFARALGDLCTELACYIINILHLNLRLRGISSVGSVLRQQLSQL